METLKQNKNQKTTPQCNTEMSLAEELKVHFTWHKNRLAQGDVHNLAGTLEFPLRNPISHPLITMEGLPDTKLGEMQTESLTNTNGE